MSNENIPFDLERAQAGDPIEVLYDGWQEQKFLVMSSRNNVVYDDENGSVHQAYPGNVRMKRKPKIIRYRCWLSNAGGVHAFTEYEHCSLDYTERSFEFKQWIHHEWQEYEVKE